MLLRRISYHKCRCSILKDFEKHSIHKLFLQYILEFCLHGQGKSRCSKFLKVHARHESAHMSIICLTVNIDLLCMSKISSLISSFCFNRYIFNVITNFEGFVLAAFGRKICFPKDLYFSLSAQVLCCRRIHCKLMVVFQFVRDVDEIYCVACTDSTGWN